MNEEHERYCVLMSVYAKEQPLFFRAAMGSILAQTQPPDQIVLICDGPLTDALEQVITDTAHVVGSRLEVVRLSRNGGLGPALMAGLSKCKYQYVARMDTDDIARPERCEKQLAFMSVRGLDLCSGAVAEFVEDPTKITSTRSLPQYHEALVKFAKRRNPMNHPCVMFRKKAVEQAGGYRVMPYFEDYDLWVRMIQHGAKLGNMCDILVDMRTGVGLYRRRGGIAYCRAMRHFYRDVRASGLISNVECLQNVMLRCMISLLPSGLRELFYLKMLRTPVEDDIV